MEVVCVDPDGGMRERLRSTFEGRETVTAVATDTVGSALDAIADGGADCIVAEYELPDGTAFELFEAARDRHPGITCLLFTGRDYDEIDSERFRKTVVEYVPKDAPEAIERLADRVRETVTNRTQVGFPVPPEEDERLATLSRYDIEGLSAVETFDRLSTLVANHFDVSVAFVGLLEEARERFVACHGADWETLDREDSICTYAILEDTVTVIENVQADPRFANNETLEELDIRSYAGADLTAPDGTEIGELCLIHDEPRSYTEDELEDLQLFAEEISEQFELRRRLGAEGIELGTGEDSRNAGGEQ